MKYYSLLPLLLCYTSLPTNSVAVKHLKGSAKKEGGEAPISATSFSSNTAAVVGKKSQLLMDGYCWIHDNGKFCFKGSSFQSITKRHDELYHEIFTNGKKFTYLTTNVEKVKRDYASLPPSGDKKIDHVVSEYGEIFDALHNVKYDCQVEEAIDIKFDPNDLVITSSHSDGSSIQKFHDLIIFVDSENKPITVLSPNEKKRGEYEPLAAITHVEKLDDHDNNDFVICDPHRDLRDAFDVLKKSPDAKRRLLNVLDAHDPSVSEEEYFAKVAERDHRRLQSDWFEDFQNWASNTNWCGAGTDKVSTPCPNPADTSKDFIADVACRRHDHGGKYQITWVGLPRLECKVDKQLVDYGGHNFAVQFAYGTFGVMGTVGCFNWESYWCWRGWRYRHCGYRWDINSGPFRYNGAIMRRGYVARPKYCQSDSLVSW